jgi:hypothetical protein
MIWPEKCAGCGDRRPGEKPVLYNPRTNRAYCRKCEAMPGFWRTLWGTTSTAIRRGVAEEDDNAQ